MTTIENVDWDVCEQCAKDGGIGVRLPSEQDLTYTGRLIQALLRFVGPVLAVACNCSHCRCACALSNATITHTTDF